MARDRLEGLLRAIVAADNRASGQFITVTTFDGTDLLHPGFRDEVEIELSVGDVQALAARGDLIVTGHRDHGDVAFVVTEQGHASAERLERGGPTELEAKRLRANELEAQLKDGDEAVKSAQARVLERRERIANRIAWIPALAIAVAISVVIFLLSESGPVRAIVGVLLALGVAGSWFLIPVRKAIAVPVARLLRWVHDRT